MEKTIHQGRNVKRFREMLGLKQQGLANKLGDDWDQRKISLLEQKEIIETELLMQVAKALEIPAEAIENFDDETAINIISNTVNNNDNATGNSLFMYYPTFNPIERWMEALEENKKLYTALLKEKDEKIVLLKELLDKKK